MSSGFSFVTPRGDEESGYQVISYRYPSSDNSVSSREITRCSDQKTADLSAKLFAAGNSSYFVPLNHHAVSVVGISGSFVPIEIKANGTMVLNGTQEMNEEIALKSAQNRAFQTLATFVPANR